MPKEKTKPPVKVVRPTVLDIIDACKTAGVRSFKDGKLEILFSDNIQTDLVSGAVAPPPSTEEKPAMRSRDDLLFDLCVADPLAFEEELSKDLEEA